MKMIFLLLNIFIFLNCKEITKDLTINIYSNNQRYEIGKENGIITMKSELTTEAFDRNDMENLTKFTINFVADETSNKYNLNCRL